MIYHLTKKGTRNDCDYEFTEVGKVESVSDFDALIKKIAYTYIRLGYKVFYTNDKDVQHTQLYWKTYSYKADKEINRLNASEYALKSVVISTSIRGANDYGYCITTNVFPWFCKASVSYELLCDTTNSYKFKGTDTYKTGYEDMISDDSEDLLIEKLKNYTLIDDEVKHLNID
jgi:hypothetical protein